MMQKINKYIIMHKRLLLCSFCMAATALILLVNMGQFDSHLPAAAPYSRGQTVELLEESGVHLLCAGDQSPDHLPCLCYYDPENIQKNVMLPKVASFSDVGLVRRVRGRCAMTVNAAGRLGNLMGEYAVLYALAKKNNRPAFMLKAMANVLLMHFNLSMPILSEQLEKAKNVWTARTLHYWMEDSYAHLSETYLRIEGYPFSWTYFHHLHDEIVREFSFGDGVMKAVRHKLLQARAGRRKVTYVGIHARRSDYLLVFQMPDYRGIIADADFFSHATDYFRAKYSDCVFIVASDDMQWCRENLDNSRNDMFFAGDGEISSPILDMALLSNCNHSIITIGTFGFWTAYLAGGETVHYTNYTKPGVYYDQVMRADKLYMPNWIPIAANRTSIL